MLYSVFFLKAINDVQTTGELIELFWIIIVYH